MHWLQSIKQTESGFLGTFFNLDKSVEKAYLDDYHALYPKAYGSRTISAALDLTQWKEASAASYFPELTEEEAASTRHRVFQFDCAGASLLVPAYVFMRAFVPSLPRRSIIFSPGDLDEYGFIDEDGRVFAFPQDNYTRSKMPPLRTELELFRYLMAYPSGREFWASVYRNLSTGAVDVGLPRASLTIEARGYIRGSHFCVETLALREIEALEDAPARHADVPKRFNLGNTNVSGRWGPMSCQGLVNLLRRRSAYPGEPEISDREWRQIKRLLGDIEQESVSPETLRWCVESILYKEATGESWYDFLAEWEGPFVYSWYRVWQGSGVLDSIQKKLASMRAAA